MKQDRSPFTERFFEAWHRLDVRLGHRVKKNEFAKLVGEQLGGATLSPNTVTGWELGALPDLETVGAMATLCRVHPSWLAWGLGSADDPVFGEISVRGDVARQEAAVPSQPSVTKVGRTVNPEDEEERAANPRKARDSGAKR